MVLARLREVSKRFGTLLAVDGLSIDVRAGEVHGLIGGNGAGKTTAMKLLAGLERPDGGVVEIDGRPIVLGSRADGIRAGVGFIQQEFSLVESLTCAENVLLGHPEHGFVLDRRGAAKAIAELGDRFDVTLDPDRPVRTLSMGERQQLEILIALSWGGRVVILDEPTSATGESGLEFLRRAVQVLRESGVGVVYISHKLPEVLELADRVTVMRAGRAVWAGPAAGADAPELARAMVGDAALLVERREVRPAGEHVLRLVDVDVDRAEEERSLRGVTLEVRRHEIVGIAGAVGNGQRELARVAARPRRARTPVRSSGPTGSGTWPRIEPATASRSTSRPPTTRSSTRTDVRRSRCTGCSGRARSGGSPSTCSAGSRSIRR